MTLRTRNILFYCLTALFFIIAVSAVFYSNGWRFDPETFTINKLGGIYFEEVPDGSTLFMEKIGVEFSPSFLRSTYLAPNLFPKNYLATVSRENHQVWTKEIPVYPSLVTEIQPIILLPEKLILENPIRKNISGFWEKSGQIITGTKSGELFSGSYKIPGTQIISWSDDASAVISKNEGNYYLVDLNSPGSALNLTLMFSNARKAELAAKERTPVKHASFQPGHDDSFIIHTDNGLYLLDSESSTLSVISSAPISAYAGNSYEILFSNKTGLFSWSSGKTATLTPSLPIGDPAEMIFNDAETYFLIKSDSGRLLITSRNNLETKLLANNARAVFFAPGYLKLAFTTFNNELVIHTFGKKYQLLDDPKTEVLRLSIADEGSLAWHADAAHIFMQYPNAAYLLEANGMPPINLQKIDDGVDKFQYDAENEELYILKNSNLYKINI